MNREIAKELAIDYANWAKDQGFDFWVKVTDPMTWSELHNKYEIQVLIEVLEIYSDKLLLHCVVDGDYKKKIFESNADYNIVVTK